MLMLTRKFGQRIFIGQEAQIKLHLQPTHPIQRYCPRIKVYIEAPKCVPIVREEIFGLREDESRTIHQTDGLLLAN